MYNDIQKTIGPVQNKTAPQKSSMGETIRDIAKQTERWLEHYSDLYSRESKVFVSALEAIDNNNNNNDKALSKGGAGCIDSLSCGKAPGMDGIPPEVIKCRMGILLPHLHKLLYEC